MGKKRSTRKSQKRPKRKQTRTLKKRRGVTTATFD